MRRRHLLRACRLLLLASLAKLPAHAQTTATELAGIRMEPTSPLAGQTLKLNGAGIRYKAIFQVYTAALYLAQTATTAEAVMAAPGPKRLHIVMLREIDANELGKLFTRGMANNAPREVFAKCISGTLQLAELFSRKKRLMPGDSFSVDWVPGVGTTVMVNGKAETDAIGEPVFFNAMLGIWLGKDPADHQLKAALLGADPAH